MDTETTISEKTIGVLMTLQTPVIDDMYKSLVFNVQRDNPTAELDLIVYTPAVVGSKNTPFEYKTVEWMAACAFDGAFKIVRQIKDCNDHERWCATLDELIPENGIIYEFDNVILSAHEYSKFGKRETRILNTGLMKHEAELREKNDSETQTVDFRRGMMHSSSIQYDSVFPTVDCVIFSDDTLSKIYMAKKPDEKKWRFIGGFADPNDTSYSCTARREAKEETGLDCVCFDWIGSARIDDWRYRNERNKIITNIFAMKVVGGELKAQDDIKEVKLFSIDELTFDSIQPEHQIIFEKVKHYITKYKHLDLYWC